MRHYSAFGTHFESQRTREDPLNPQLPAHAQPLLDPLVTVSPEKDASYIPLDAVAFPRCLGQFGEQPTRHEQQRMELVSIHVTGQELRTIQHWHVRIIVPITRSRHCHHRGTTPHHHHGPNFKPRSFRLSTHSALSSVLSVLPRWMEGQGREHASHLL